MACDTIFYTAFFKEWWQYDLVQMLNIDFDEQDNAVSVNERKTYNLSI